MTALSKWQRGENSCRLQSPMSPQPTAKSWQAENPDQRLVPPRPRKALMKRCSAGSCWLLAAGGLSRCWRSLGVLYRQDQIAGGEVVVQPLTGCCFVLLFVSVPCYTFKLACRASHLHFNRLFKFDISHRSIRVLLGLQHHFVKIEFTQLKATWQGDRRQLSGALWNLFFFSVCFLFFF